MPATECATKETASLSVTGRPASRQVSNESVKRSKSFLNPTGVNATTAPPKEVGPWMEMFVFVSYILISAFHPIFIDGSKSVDEETGKKYYGYEPMSAVILMTLLISVFTLVFCYAVGGKKEFDSVFIPKPLILFSINGAAYALGDYLQMASMGSINGAAYQILMQSRIILTASLMICIKGVFQTRLQWILLSILMCSMSTYMVIESGDAGSGDSGVPLTGMFIAFVKVVLSCSMAVVSDKYMKVYKDDSTHVQLARIHVGRAVAIVIFSFFTPVYSGGFFNGWNSMTVAVTVAFIAKSVSSLYVLSLLDSILKNIAESFAVLVIYGYDVLMPWVQKEFELPTFLAILVVVSACAAYVDSKEPIEKAAQYDAYQCEQQKMTKSKTYS
mmetsp:Transcript_18159/g.28591  ORF Transcript_18159/g.28591 Transcript_18159/m.28591 type:complete len:387 (-) Transcript_18159:255-1415(-)